MVVQVIGDIMIKQHLIYIIISVLVLFLIALFLFVPSRNVQIENVGKNYAEPMVLADYNDYVCVYYKLWVNGSLVENIFDENKPFCFVLGKGTIVGFAKGILGMSVGEERTFIVEPSEGYGAKDRFLDVNQPLSWVMSYIKSKTNKDYLPKQVLGTKLFVNDFVCNFVGYDLNKNLAFLKCQHKYAGKYLKFKVKLVKLVKDHGRSGDKTAE